ncbi:YARHG domain-containing protein [Clostridium sp. AM58-1XD]|uniref:YARHG domain-containing protein n=1 Tax=Clostridium sp. AM58-1XD TaxID=2292307 RepID=UPI001FA89060|nr:YARHG domain-containing protein [Clostridium sp. AM58-1XD]
MKMKNKLITILAAAAVAGMMGSCGTKAKEADREAAQVSEEQPTEEEDGSEETEDESESVNTTETEQPSAGPEETESEGGVYDKFISDQLIPRLSTADNRTFQYGFEANYYDSSYWYAAPMTAQLSDGIISTCQRDLDGDGNAELLVIYLEGSLGTGNGKNNICLDVYSNMGQKKIMRTGSISFADCFSGYNGENYMVGLKTIGNQALIYMAGGGHVWTWADGTSPQIRLYQYNGGLTEIYNVSTEGSDDSWMEGWQRDLRSFGFDIVDNQWGYWDEYYLTGETNFEMLLFGECSTVVNEDEMYGSSDPNGAQKYLLERGVIRGSLVGQSGGTASSASGTTEAFGSGNSGAAAASSGDYILPQSSSTYLTPADLSGLTREQISLARNEIYARHGRKFQKQELQDYFNSKPWYMGTIEPGNFSEDMLNEFERANVKLIKGME